MSATPEDVLMRACKLQLEAATGMIEALTQRARQMGEAQLKGDAQVLWRLQNEWATANLEKSVAYWREFYEIALAAQASIAQRLSEQMQLATGQAPAGAAPQIPLLEMMDAAYQRWLESTRQFYAPPAVSKPQVRQPA